MDLAVCVDALEERQNAIYQWHFVRNLKRRMRRKAAALPGKWSLDALPGIRSIRDFDDAYTAPHHGFRDAADYYHRASAMRVIDKISIPALIITAADDPFVPPGRSRSRWSAATGTSRVKLTPHGGHCGFVEESSRRLRRLLGGAGDREFLAALPAWLGLRARALGGLQ